MKQLCAVPARVNDMSCAGRFLTRRQAAELLGLKPSTLACWRSQQVKDAPPMRKHGGRAVYSERDLLEWSERRKVS